MSQYGRLREPIVERVRAVKRELSTFLNRHPDPLPANPAAVRERAAELLAIAERWEAAEADVAALNARTDLE